MVSVCCVYKFTSSFKVSIFGDRLDSSNAYRYRLFSLAR